MEKAKDSKQVERARKKLRKQIKEEHKLINSQALKNVGNDIKKWLSTNSKERLKLKDKRIELFDENKHSEKVRSRFVKDLLNKLITESQVKNNELKEDTKDN